MVIMILTGKRVRVLEDVGLSNQTNSSNVSTNEEVLKIKFWPRAESEIIDRLPEIRADLSEFNNIDPQKIMMKVSGFGVVPSDFDEDKGIVKWRVPRKLRVKSTSVFLSFVDPLDETNKNISWSFNCLLYTSPSPRDATLSRMPSSA